MNILLTGLGSIGTRHLQNILALGYTDIAVVSSKKKLPELFDGCKLFKAIDEALNDSVYDAAFICTPTSLHTDQLIKILQHKIRLIYLEKPVSDSLKEIDEVRRLASLYQNKIITGYDLHFDPGMIKVKELLQKKLIGTTISVNAFVGQHLSQWRPYEDHRKGMSAKKETGGGVILDLIHEFDYLYRLFGNVETIACNMISSGELEIETEEAADVLLRFENGISGSIHLDYWQQHLKRFAIITGTAGTITWNLAEKFLELVTKTGKTIVEYKEFQRNERFVLAVQSFLEEKNNSLFSSFEDGVKSLEIVLAAKQSAEEKRIVKLPNKSYAGIE